MNIITRVVSGLVTVVNHISAYAHTKYVVVGSTLNELKIGMWPVIKQDRDNLSTVD